MTPGHSPIAQKIKLGSASPHRIAFPGIFQNLNHYALNKDLNVVGLAFPVTGNIKYKKLKFIAPIPDFSGSKI
jgi:hypothetical protein